MKTVDLTHAHTLFTDGFVANQLCREFGVPYVITVRSTDIAIFVRYFRHLRQKAKEVLNEASCVVFINNEYETWLSDSIHINLPPSKVIVAPNGADSEWLYGPQQTPRRESVARGDDINVVCVAKVVGHKNHRYLINAINVLNSRNPNRRVRLKIIGDYNSRFGLKIRSLYESETIEFAGAIDQAQIKLAFAEADVFALPSYSETFGIAYVEAISQRLPVIYTQGEGFDNWAPDGYWGVSCQLDDVDQLCDKIEMLAFRGRLASESLDQLRLLFDWPVIAESIGRQYQSSIQSSIY